MGNGDRPQNSFAVANQLLYFAYSNLTTIVTLERLFSSK